MSIYKVGDRPWLARAGRRQVKVPCPVCYGKLEVKLTLGNGDEVMLPCDYCGHGYEPPCGTRTEHEWSASAEQVYITSVDITETEGGEKRRYHSPTCYVHDAEDLFDTEEEAVARCAVLIEEYEHDQRTRAEYIKQNVKKKFSWNAGYHLREAKRDEASAARHREKAKLCKARAK